MTDLSRDKAISRRADAFSAASWQRLSDSQGLHRGHAHGPTTHLCEDRLVDVEHGVTVAVACQREDGACLCDHLADFRIARGDDAGDVRFEHGVGELILRQRELGAGGIELRLRAAQRLLCGWRGW